MGNPCEFLPRLWGHGGSVFDEQGKLTLDSREAIRAMENYCESFAYASPSSVGHYWPQQVREFSQGKTAMMVMYTPQVTDINDKQKSQIASEIGFSVIPGGHPLLGGWSLAINQNSTKKRP